jgi:hypothetical protein
MEDRRHGVGGYRTEGDEGSAPLLGIKAHDRKLWRSLGYFDELGQVALSRRALFGPVLVARAVVPFSATPWTLSLAQLLMVGISIGYISRQLGHSGTQITSDHYAKWLSED